MEPILVSFQYGVFLYFLILNTIYIVFVLLSFLDVLNYTRALAPDRIWMSSAFYRPVSIVVPAYNEEKTIEASVKALLALRYPEFEVIVVNDGSKDGTLPRLIEVFKLVKTPRPVRLILRHKPIRAVYISLEFPNLVVVDKENGGKADALNAGINASRYPLFCSIDADSILERHALLRAIRPFLQDPRVIAVGGIVRVLNGSTVEGGVVTGIHAPSRAIECLQVVEYIRAFLMGRTALSRMHSLLILSGAFSVFRKDVVVAIGGYRPCITEDADLITRLHRYCREERIPYRILFIPDPICFTQVPSDLKSLLHQRSRWHRGLIDTLLYNGRTFLNPRYGIVGLWAFPYYVLFEALGPVVETLGYIVLPLLYVSGWLQKEFAILFFSVAFLWAMLINIGSVLIDNIAYRPYGTIRDVLKLCVYGILEMLGFRQILAVQRAIATFQVKKRDWGMLARERIQPPAYRLP
jgi:cellulose synthase/poly-beta-1,6-N-acetylglucosamine synthase-like glycosyltransferase